MDNLRWLLLLIGLLLIVGIYLAERYKRNRRQRRAVDRFFDDDYESGLSITPQPAEEDSDYRDSLADLGQMLAQSRDSGAAIPRRRPADSTAGRHDAESEIELPGLKHDSEPESSATTAPSTAGTGESEPSTAPAHESAPASHADSAQAEATEPERLIILYLKSPPGSAMRGPDLFRALDSVDMTPGQMGIFHDCDSRNRVVFSAANMFEPGTLETDDPARFSTRGLALFMCLPGPADEEAAFDRMLAKAELLADKLGAVLHDDKHQPLTTKAAERISRTLRPSAD